MTICVPGNVLDALDGSGHRYHRLPRHQDFAVSKAADIRRAVEAVVEPSLRRRLADLGMIREVTIDGATARVGVTVPSPTWPAQALGEEIASVVKGFDGVADVAVDIAIMTETDADELATRFREERAGTVGGTGSATRVIAIASGKGGVGKSSVAANTAVALASAGHDVGVIDADVWGYSIPGMLGVTDSPAAVADLIVPPSAHGVRAISMDFFVGDDQAVIWRGPMLHKALEQFLNDVAWDRTLGYLVIDMPPGTGDIQMALSRLLPQAEMVVVTTPQRAAQRVASRVADMARRSHMPIVGVLENMSGFTTEEGRHYDLFGSGGGEELAMELAVPLLGQIPLDPSVVEGGDNGLPPMRARPDGPAAVAIRKAAERIVALVPPAAEDTCTARIDLLARRLEELAATEPT